MGRRLQWRVGILIGVLSSLVGAQSSPTSADSKPASSTSTVPDSAPGVGPDYRIGADDVLKISVWKEPDLSETLPVRVDGKISMPLLNDVAAAGLTPTQLAA